MTIHVYDKTTFVLKKQETEMLPAPGAFFELNAMVQEAWCLLVLSQSYSMILQAMNVANINSSKSRLRYFID